MSAALSSFFFQADCRHTFCLWLDLPVLGLLRCRLYYYSYQCLLPFSHLPFLKGRYFSCPDSLLPLTDHLGQDKDYFLIAKYRIYFTCQYQQNRWHYPQAQDHLCRLLDPAVHLALGGPVDRPPLGDPAVHFALGVLVDRPPLEDPSPLGDQLDLVVPRGLYYPSAQEDPPFHLSFGWFHRFGC